MRELHSCVTQQVGQCTRKEEGTARSQTREPQQPSESHEGSRWKKNETAAAIREETIHTQQEERGWLPRAASSTYSLDCLEFHPLHALRLAPRNAQVWSVDQSRSRPRSHSFAASTTTPQIVHLQGFALENAAALTPQLRLRLLGIYWPRHFCPFSIAVPSPM